ncbi:MAG: hypothetical protein ACRDRJ_01375 [Streptosporangiaceae bacterium]
MDLAGIGDGERADSSRDGRDRCARRGGLLQLRLRALVQNWNGTKWSVTAAPNPVAGIGGFNAVSCTSATACTAVGGDARLEVVPFAEVRG